MTDIHARGRSSRRTAILAALVTAGVLAPVATAGASPSGPPADTHRRTLTRHPATAPRLVDIRTGRHGAFDRVVLDLQGSAPGYAVGYVRQVTQDGSGRDVNLRGRANLLIRLRPAAAHTANGHPTYTGSQRSTVDDPELREVALVGDYEGVVSVALGLAHRNGFRVSTLHNPTRIVVDVAH